MILLGFLGGLDGKESACNVGDLGLISESGKSPGEGNGYPLQYSCLKNSMYRGSWWAQLVKNLPAMRETWFDPWVGKIPWRREWLTHSSILAWRIPWTEEPVRLQSMGSQRVRNDWATFTAFKISLRGDTSNKESAYHCRRCKIHGKR